MKDDSIKSDSLFKNTPLVFKEYFTEVTNLKLSEQPNYNHLRWIFKELFIEKGFEDDSQFDWLEEDYSDPSVKHEDYQKESL